jgi:hypothetical protein
MLFGISLKKLFFNSQIKYFLISFPMNSIMDITCYLKKMNIRLRTKHMNKKQGDPKREPSNSIGE